jgi:D-glycerate 3-kinase
MTAAALLAACGVTDPQAWRQAWSQRLESWRQDGEPEAVAALDRAHPSLVEGFWLPLLTALERRAAKGPVVIGLNGPVGAGKSTLAKVLRDLAAQGGLRLAVASIDDAYRSWEERRRVLAGNPFGVGRVPPGSHDPEAQRAALAAWREGGLLRLPRFDKTLRGGEGDRSGWSEQPADAVLLEGWLLGCHPLPETTLAEGLASPADADSLDLCAAERAWLRRWNAELAAYQPLFRALDGLWILKPIRWTLPLRWRLQAEARQRRRNPEGGLTAAAVKALVRSSLGSLPPPLYQDPLLDSAAGVGVLDGRRRCLWSGTGAEVGAALNQLSLSSSLSVIG